jgi:hypothetical protein
VCARTTRRRTTHGGIFLRLPPERANVKRAGMNRSALFFGLSSVVALVGFAGACSSTTTTVTGDGSEAGTPTNEAGAKDSATQDTGVVEDTDSSVTPMGDEACAAATTKAACGQCCVTNHAAGAKVIQDSVVACACTGTGADGGAPACMTECAATICAAMPMNPDMACSACLQQSIAQGGACQQAASDACKASPDCVAEQMCVAPCTTKN